MNAIKPTKIRKHALQMLADGGVMKIDNRNLASINDMPVAPVNRCFLTSKRLVTRLNKTRGIEVEGNGYVITDSGRLALKDSR